MQNLCVREQKTWLRRRGSKVLLSYKTTTKKGNAVFINVFFLSSAWTEPLLPTKEKTFLTKSTLHQVSRDCGNRHSLHKYYITAVECYCKHERASKISTSTKLRHVTFYVFTVAVQSRRTYRDASFVARFVDAQTITASSSGNNCGKWH